MYRNIVVKVGTSSLTHDTGKTNFRGMDRLSRVLADLMNAGCRVTLVTSGAIAMGMGRVGLSERPHRTAKRQALAAIGQSTLMAIYDKFLSEYGRSAAQVLLTRDVLDHPERKENALNAFETLHEYGVLPIVNENDTISTDEIGVIFGDNDVLSAHVARLISADLLVLLSDTDGLYDGDPKTHPDARIIPVVPDVERVAQVAGGAGTDRGTGGMATKINAARIATAAGIPMIIANGATPEVLYDIAAGGDVGTRFLPKGGR